MCHARNPGCVRHTNELDSTYIGSTGSVFEKAVGDDQRGVSFETQPPYQAGDANLGSWHPSMAFVDESILTDSRSVMRCSFTAV